MGINKKRRVGQPRGKIFLGFNSYRIGGSQTYYLELVRLLSEIGFQAVVFAKQGILRKAFIQNSAKTKSIPWSEGSAVNSFGIVGYIHLFLDFALGIRWAVNCFLQTPTAVIVSQPWPTAFVTRWTPKKIPIYAIVHGTTSVEFPPPRFVKTMKRLHKVFCVSEESKQILVAAGVREPTVLGNLFSGPTFWGDYEQKGSVQVHEILVLATLTANKTDAVECCIRSLRHDSSWKLRIVGDGPCRENLANLVLQLGLESRVVFTGAVQDPRQYIANSEIVIAVGRAALESMSCGKPTILASDGRLFGCVNSENFEVAQLKNFTGRAGTQVLNSDSLAEAIREAFKLPGEELQALVARTERVGHFPELASFLLGNSVQK